MKLELSPAVAWARDAVRLCRQGDRRLPAHGRQGLDGAGDGTRPLLGTLALVWVAARIAALVAPYPVFMGLDMALLPAVALVLRVLIKSGNKRNIPLVSLLVLMSIANLVFHLSVLGAIAVPCRKRRCMRSWRSSSW